MSTLDDRNRTTPPPVPPDRVTANENPSDATDVEGASKELKDLGELRSDMSDYTENRSQDQVLDAPVTTPADAPSLVSADSSFSAESAPSVNEDGIVPLDREAADVEAYAAQCADADDVELTEEVTAITRRFGSAVLTPDVVTTLQSDSWVPSVDGVRKLVSDQFFAALDREGLASTTPLDVLADLLHAFELRAARMVNGRPDVSTGAKGTYMRVKVPEGLRPVDAARLMARAFPLIYLSAADDDSGARADRATQLLLRYRDAGTDEGLYTSLAPGEFRMMLREMTDSASLAYAAEVEDAMRSLVIEVPSRVPFGGSSIIAFRNGLFDTAAPEKGVQPFSPDIVVTSKVYVSLPASYAPVLRESIDDATGDRDTWDVVTWISTLVDPQDVPFVMQVLRCAVDPVKAATALRLMVVATGTGRNGKSTLSLILRAITGEQFVSGISLTDFGEHFGVETIIGKRAIICDDNDADNVFKSTGVWKSIADHKPFEVKRKGLPALPYRFTGLNWQNLNGDFRSRDKSNAFRRRVALLDFPHDFTGVQHSDIEDFVVDEEVLSSLVAYLMYELEDFDVVKPSAHMTEAWEDMTREDSPIQDWIDINLANVLDDGFDAWHLGLLYVGFRDDMGEGAKAVTERQFAGEVKAWVKAHPDCGWREVGRDEMLTFRRFMTARSSFVSAHLRAYERSGWEVEEYSDQLSLRHGKLSTLRGRGIVRTHPATLEAAEALGDKETVARIEAEAQAAKVATQAAKQELIDVSARALARARSYEPVPALPTSGPAVGDTSVMRPCDMTREDCFAELPRLRKVMKAVEEEVKDIEEDIKKAAEADMPECGLLDDRHKEVDTRRKEVMGQLLNLERNAGRFSHLASLPEDRYVEFLEVEAALVREQAPAPEAPARRDTDATGEPSLHVYHVYELGVGGLVTETKRLRGLLAHAKANGEPVIDLGAQLEVLLREVSLRLGFMRGIPSLRGLFDDDIKKLESVVADQDAPPVLTEPDLPAALVRYLHGKASVPAAPAHRDTAALDVDDLDEDECRIEVARLRKTIGENSRRGVPVTNLEARRDAVEARLGRLVAQRDADGDSDELVSAPPTSAGSDD